MVLSLNKLREMVKACQRREWCKSVEVGRIRDILETVSRAA